MCLFSLQYIMAGRSCKREEGGRARGRSSERGSCERRPGEFRERGLTSYVHPYLYVITYVTYRKSLPRFCPISVNYIPIKYQPIPYRNTNSRCNPTSYYSSLKLCACLILDIEGSDVVILLLLCSICLYFSFSCSRSRGCPNPNFPSTNLC